MALVTWTDKLSLGIKEIDNQHKKWIDIINQLNEAMRSGKSKEVLEDVFKQLIDYTDFHFKTEEQLFEKYGYPEKLSHKMVHQKMVNEVKNYYNDFKSGKLTVSLNLMQLLSNWLLDHIQKVDKNYAPFFIEKGVK
jgi:hemerythrin-like metal-binding protein